MLKRMFLYAVFLMMLVPSTVLASGFAINEQGAKALGMGGAFAAQADDPTAVYYNPAGITQLEGTQFSIGAAVITPSVSFESDGTTTVPGAYAGEDTTTEDRIFIVPNMYITHKVSDRFSIGLGSFTNFGLGTDWPDNWEGSFLIGGTNAEIKTYTLNPVVALEASDKLSLSFGFFYQQVDVNLESRLAPIMHPVLGELHRETDLIFNTESGEYGYNVGLLYEVNKNWKVGFSHRSSVKHTTKGDVKTSDNELIPALGARPYDAYNTDVTADLTLPAVTYLGTAYTRDKLTVEFDIQFTEWSSYDQLESVEVGLSKDKDWNDALALRLGGQYSFNEMFDLRLGLVRDYSPVPDETVDPMLPSGDRWLYTIGAGLNFGDLGIDLAYNYLQDEARDYDNQAGDFEYPAGVPQHMEGTYKDNYAHIFAVNVKYKF
ncbi:OmpP1/FadL family transporter [Limisalsivibrio acetivorans]|uniref:OmpP1/FadL family transporter n=1 Tax=Limisalsivibrio acetivorans TaxID=1304888 RepID=UPI0003B43B18|nr:outer membrane protein transport protein [Limisalsivibrio acetivorans]